MKVVFVAFSGIVLALLVLLHRDTGHLAASARRTVDPPVIAQPCGSAAPSAPAASSTGAAPTPLTLSTAPCGSVPDSGTAGGVAPPWVPR